MGVLLLCMHFPCVTDSVQTYGKARWTCNTFHSLVFHVCHENTETGSQNDWELKLCCQTSLHQNPYTGCITKRNQRELMQGSTSRPNRCRLSMVLKGWAPSSVGESLPGLGRQEMDAQTESDLVSAVVSGGISSQTTLFPFSQPLNQWFSTLLILQPFTYLFMYLFNTISLMDLWEIYIMNPT